MDAATRSAAVLLALLMAGCSAGPHTAATAPAADAGPAAVSSGAPLVAVPAVPAAEPVPPEPVVAPVRPPVASGFGYGDPAEVCAAFAAALYSADTVADAGPADAYRRAAAYMSGALAAQSAAAARDSRWETWRRQRARLETSVEVLDPNPRQTDTAVTSRRSVLVTAVPAGDRGWRGPEERSVLDCDLRRGGPDGAGWRVAHYQVQTAGLR
ncbi:hypothetical protein [Actinoplanes sp. OR16]|uniref:hypothetical protein n=1 Tax=Actinoplanes sp. OR16 TaxID=946334 RepID=UPI000FD9AED6|nr:hypothetical protein [Actinoplanes sp. OR16]